MCGRIETQIKTAPGVRTAKHGLDEGLTHSLDATKEGLMPNSSGPRMSRARKSVADWRSMIYRHRGPGVGNGVRVLMLYLADNMRSDLQVSVPRSRIADDLGVSASEIRTRLHAAVEAGLLDHVRRGRPGVTAVYAATFPDSYTPSGHGMGNPPSKTEDQGNPGVPAKSKHGSTKLEIVSSDSSHSSSCVAAATAAGVTGSYTSASAPDGSSTTADAARPKKTNNAISEEFAHSQDKRDLLDLVQKVAHLRSLVVDDPGSGDGWWAQMDAVWKAEEDLDALFTELFGETGIASWGLDDRGWEIKPRESNRFLAGVWLNKYLNWYQQDQGITLKWSPRQRVG